MAKLLLIDDEPDVIESPKSYLTRRKHQVFTATNLPQAIEAIKKESPDIVFCDIKPERRNHRGLDILEEAKKIKPDIIFYIITSPDKEIEEQGLSLGAKEILTKPISTEDLEKKIKETIEPNKP